MRRNEKEGLVQNLGEIFNKSQTGILVDFRGLTVSQITDLRRRLHEVSTGMRVLKNRLAKIAVKGTNFEPLDEHFTETRALVYGDDPVGPAKVVTEYQKENEKLKVLLGVLVTKAGGTVIDLAQIKVLGAMPSRAELLAMLLSVITAPKVKLVRTLNEIPAKFVRTLAAIQAAKESG